LLEVRIPDQSIGKPRHGELGAETIERIAVRRRDTPDRAELARLTPYARLLCLHDEKQRAEYALDDRDVNQSRERIRRRRPHCRHRDDERRGRWGEGVDRRAPRWYETAGVAESIECHGDRRGRTDRNLQAERAGANRLSRRQHDERFAQIGRHGGMARGVEDERHVDRAADERTGQVRERVAVRRRAKRIGIDDGHHTIPSCVSSLSAVAICSAATLMLVPPAISWKPDWASTTVAACGLSGGKRSRWRSTTSVTPGSFIIAHITSA